MSEEHKRQNKQDKKWYQSTWLKRIGLLGFLFFLIKGFIWIAIWVGFFKWIGAE